MANATRIGTRVGVNNEHLTNLELLGPAALTDPELLSVVLGVSVETARGLHTSSLNELGRRESSRVMEAPGIGLIAARKLASLYELVRRTGVEKYRAVRMDSPQAVNELVAPALRLESREILQVVLVNTRHHLISVETISIGTINESLAHPREILRPAIANSAFGFILVHNHPSGDPSPSQADRQLTRRIAEAAAVCGVKVLDHLIVGLPSDQHEPYFSFREMGLL